MQPHPWFKFYPRDFLVDEKVQMMSNAQVGIYIKLLCLQWLEGSVPTQCERIATVMPFDSDAYARTAQPYNLEELNTVLKLCFVPHPTRPDRLCNRKLYGILREQEQKSQTNQHSAEKRWGNANAMRTHTVNAMRTHDKRIVNAMRTQCSSESESDLKTSSSVSQKKPSRKASATRRSILPEDFKPKPKHEEIAKGLGINLAVELVKFRDHHQAKGSLMLDWDAALRKWLRNTVDFRRPR